MKTPETLMESPGLIRLSRTGSLICLSVCLSVCLCFFRGKLLLLSVFLRIKQTQTKIKHCKSKNPASCSVSLTHHTIP